MKSMKLEEKIKNEVLDFIASRKSLHLATITGAGEPFISYAPFALGDNCIYVLISEIALHAVNLQELPKASVMMVEDEGTAKELFARIRVSYSVDSKMLDHDKEEWIKGIDIMAARHGDRIKNLSELSDFKLFKLLPISGRYVKGFGRAYSFAGGSLAGDLVQHLRDGHKKRAVA